MDTEQVLSKLISRQRCAPAVDKNRAERAAVERQLARKESLSAALYSDWKSGVLSYEEYRFAKERYAQETAALRRQLNEMRSFYAETSGQRDAVSRLAEKIRAYQEADQVTGELVEAFISSVRLSGDGEVSIRFSFEKEQALLERELERLKRRSA